MASEQNEGFVEIGNGLRVRNRVGGRDKPGHDGEEDHSPPTPHPQGEKRESPRDEIPARDSLRVEQGGEVGVVDARVRIRRDLWLGAVGDAEAGGLRTS